MNSDLSSLFPPRQRRVHEVFGAGALFFAFALSGSVSGRVLWICENWKSDDINPVGFGAFSDPDRFVLVKAKDHADILAVAEEALRSGAVSLVVMELSKPLELTPGRRLQLAAETGRVMGLCIISEGMGSNSAETRWCCSPLFDPRDSTLQRWEINKNKSGTLGAWDVRWDAETRRIIVVSEAAQRQGSTRTSG